MLWFIWQCRGALPLVKIWSNEFVNNSAMELGLVVSASLPRPKKMSYGNQDQFLSPRARTPRILRKIVAVMRVTF